MVGARAERKGHFRRDSWCYSKKKGTLYKGWLVLELRERDTLEGMVGAITKRKGHFRRDGRC